MVKTHLKLRTYRILQDLLLVNEKSFIEIPPEMVEFALAKKDVNGLISFYKNVNYFHFF